jgi:Xaa-Pro dipeptidase
MNHFRTGGSLSLILALSCCFLIILSQKQVSAFPLNMPSLVDKRATAEFTCTTCEGPFYSQGLETYRVPMAMYELNRARLVQAMLQKLGGKATGIILLQGGQQQTRYDTDNEPVFRQESYFHWAFGVPEAGVYGAISMPTGRATLFVPKYGLDYEVFCGESPSIDSIRAKYGVEDVLFIDDLPAYIESHLEQADDAQLHLMTGLNSDSGNMAMPAHYDGISQHAPKMTTDTLFDCIAESRVIKTDAEVDAMRYTHWVSSMAHVEVMRNCKAGMMEYQLESLFQHHTYTHGGCRHQSYTCICACGPNPAVLHYGHAGAPNNRLLEDGDLALLDMGAEYHCYASDITCSYPVNGRFTDDQRMVYEAVLEAQVAVLAAMRPGTTWPEMHRAAERAILQGLVKTGLLTGNVDDMLAAHLGAIFMPHGLGHLIGLDTHDVGGYATGTPARSDQPGLSKLRTARVLEVGMVLTVEPGCYFINVLLDIALKNPAQSIFFNTDRLKDFRNFGGARLEDGVLVTPDGCENLTMCPRTVSEVLSVMSGGSWPPEKDAMPELRRNWVKREAGKMVRFTLPS